MNLIDEGTDIMKYTIKKLIAFLMAFLMVFQMMPASVLAENDDEQLPAYEGGQPAGELKNRSTVTDCDVNYTRTVVVDSDQNNSPNYFAIAKNPDGLSVAYAQLLDGESSLQFTNGNAPVDIKSNYSFVIIKTSDTASSTILNINIDQLSNDEKVTDGSGVIDSFYFVWNTEALTDATRPYFTIHASDKELAGGDIGISVAFSGDDVDFSSSTDHYYLVAGWNDGPTSYGQADIENNAFAKDYTITVPSVEPGKESSYKPLFICFKKYGASETGYDPRELTGTAIVGKPGSIFYASNTFADGDNTYQAVLTGPTVAEGGKKNYTVTISKSSAFSSASFEYRDENNDLVTDEEDVYVIRVKDKNSSNEEKYLYAVVPKEGGSLSFKNNDG